jgi:hypothetical protein
MSNMNRESLEMRDIMMKGQKVKIRGRFTAAILPLVVTMAVMTGCEGMLDVAADPHYVDASTNPAQLNETLVGAQVDMNYAYDVWMYETNMFAGGMAAVGQLRYTNSLRQIYRSGGQAGGLTGGTRDKRGPGVGYYAFLQQALASSKKAQSRILAGEFDGITDPSGSAEYARVSVYRGFELIWISDFYCEFVLDGAGPVHTSAQGYAMAKTNFNAALSASGASASDKSAARAGLARVERLLGNDATAAGHAAQVAASFKYEAGYSQNTFPQTNHVWFRTWGFGEHTIAAGFQGLKLDDGTTIDPRTATTTDPVPPRGDHSAVYAPNKVPSGASSLIITSGVEMQFVVAESLITSNADSAKALLNTIREARGVTEDVATSLTGTALRDKLIEERRRTLFLEGTILGDTRLYKTKYSVDKFHTSVPQGLTVGTMTCRLVPQREIDNIPGLVYTSS